MKNFKIKCTAIIFMSLFFFNVSAMDLYQNLGDLISNADLIVRGKCRSVTSFIDSTHFNTIYTKSVITDIEIIRLNNSEIKIMDNTIVLESLGGTFGERKMMVCDNPEFTEGKEYIIFLKYDGKKYMTPVIGGTQGIFFINRDQQTGEEYLSDYFSHIITGIDNFDFVKTNFPVSSMKNYFPSYDQTVLNAVNDDSIYKEISPLKIEQLKKMINDFSFSEPAINKWVNHSNSMPCLPLKSYTQLQNSIATSPQNATTLGACGYQDVYIWFEEVPTSWDSYSPDDYTKSVYDHFINIYSDAANPSDGWAPGNDEDEIVGWLTNSQIYSAYGYNWPVGATAMTVLYWTCSGCEITESDIMFNQSFNWVFSESDAFNTTNINYQNNIIHELGHSWGYQDGCGFTETYDYSVPSVMHSYYYNIWEDGKEIHARDAKVIRDAYDNQATVANIEDIGIESYYTSSGHLVNSYLDQYSVYNGNSVVLNNYSVENNSTVSKSNIHAKFYLSANRTLSSSDFLVQDYNIGSVAAETKTNHDITLPIDGIPPGVYYIALKVTIGSQTNDDRPLNDLTWLAYTIQVENASEINEINKPEILNIQPNPAENNISVSLENRINDFKIFDMLGRQHFEVNESSRIDQNNISLDITDLINGQYLIYITDINGNCFVGKFIKK